MAAAAATCARYDRRGVLAAFNNDPAEKLIEYEIWRADEDGEFYRYSQYNYSAVIDTVEFEDNKLREVDYHRLYSDGNYLTLASARFSI